MYPQSFKGILEVKVIPGSKIETLNEKNVTFAKDEKVTEACIFNPVFDATLPMSSIKDLLKLTYETFVVQHQFARTVSCLVPGQLSQLLTQKLFYRACKACCKMLGYCPLSKLH